MSYAGSGALQAAVYAALSADPDIETLGGAAIYDALPTGAVPDLYISLGPERVRDRSDKTGRGAVHDFPVTVTSRTAGFETAKALAAAISDALSGADLTLAEGRLVQLRFTRARAQRVGGARQIELWFRAHVDFGAA